ncbi:aminotransferase class V-fold PLP-dependent enzyme [Thalassotalea mangrovi]|uniref:Aminotransferase class V-fold PLP-dependent enzyme n=1 Tax=Thalassotalea mangrovi TaxID=2572245 RepID=A0A4U1B8Z9_9GAMM|nr:aminotransferase class V-fold PLP-dependent enzyme [Thalassotalea mangrovi]TKB47113.1 aminotransferase class V-fold PLP-dependent enzyme [Thalassotalea mangrovi]
MLRRQFLNRLGLSLGATFLTTQQALAFTSASSKDNTGFSSNEPISPGDWQALRDLFPLTRDYIQLATFLLASHPKPVADAITRHRQALDENPADYWHSKYLTIDGDIAKSAADYMGGDPKCIALTDSTTMGLGLVYSGLSLKPDDEILHTTHDHYSTDMSLAHRASRTGAKVRQIDLYDNAWEVTVDDVCQRLKSAIQPQTRVFACTWVHSSTGVKLPIRAMADVIAEINQGRDKQDQILFCVDGVHGFGIEDQDISKLGCDFFIAGTHKWIFGPRGTGIIWGKDTAWQRSEVVIPSFSASYDVWLGNLTQDKVPVGEHMSPGGFHSFEHRWALPEAFKLHMQLGKQNVQQRIHELNTQTKQGLAKMSHVKLHTPMDSQLSSGLVCFEVDGLQPEEVVKKLHTRGVIMSNTPYRKTYARFAPSLLNNEKEMDVALAEINRLG